jgi:hypothetical protein
MNIAIPKQILRVLCAVLFVAWLPCWVYPASKMLSFSANPMRNTLLGFSILILNLWAICFAGLVKGTPKPRPGAPKGSAGFATQLIPFCISAFLGILYVLFTGLYHTSHPTWPSPMLPFETCLAPVVFITGFSVWQNSKTGSGEPGTKKKSK